MKDNFLNDYLTVCIEKKVIEKFSIDSIIDKFNSMKEHNTHFTFKKKMLKF